MRRQRLQNLAHARDHVGIAPVAVAEQDQAWVARLRQREQTRVVDIGGDDGPPLLLRASQDFDVGRTIEAQFGGMNGVVPLTPEPCRQHRRKRHVDQELHGSTRRCKLDRLVLGEEGRVAQRLVDVAWFEIGIGLQNLLTGFARGQEPEQPRHREPQSPDARLAGAYGRIDGDARKVHYNIIRQEAAAREPAISKRSPD